MLLHFKSLSVVKRVVFSFLTLFLLISIYLLSLNQPEFVTSEVTSKFWRLQSYRKNPSNEAPAILGSDPVADLVQSLFSSIRLHPTDRLYHDPEGRRFTGGNGPDSHWKKPLGKQVVILDIDTRAPTTGNQILNSDKKIDWTHVESSGIGLTSHAIVSHSLYAMIHGYDYKYIQAAKIPGHYDTWIRPHLFKKFLPDYQFVVHMDADAMISHPEIPIEWLFNRWGITNDTSFAMPHDTEEFENDVSISTDSKGVPVLNAGFVITQNNNLTFEMLEAWANCTTEARYPGCGRWKEQWSHEQRAFSEYIRYDFNRTPETIVTIPCDDAMGYPGYLQDSTRGREDCRGYFVRHYTLGKAKVHAVTSDIYAQLLAEVSQKRLLQHAKEFWIKEEKPTIDQEEKSQEEKAKEEKAKEEKAKEEKAKEEKAKEEKAEEERLEEESLEEERVEEERVDEERAEEEKLEGERVEAANAQEEK